MKPGGAVPGEPVVLASRADLVPNPLCDHGQVISLSRFEFPDLENERVKLDKAFVTWGTQMLKS